MTIARLTFLVIVWLVVLFLVDLSTPTDIMVPIFYVVPVAIGGFAFSLLRGFLLAVLCVTLTLAGHVYSPFPGNGETALTNRFLVTCVIMLTLLTAWFLCWLRPAIQRPS